MKQYSIEDIKNIDVKSKLISKYSWQPIVVSIVVLLLVTILKGLMDFDFAEVLTLKYWGEVALTTLVGMIVFDYCYFNFIAKERLIDGTVYAIEAKEHYRYQKIIRDNKLREQLIPKVKAENERRKEEAQTKVLYTYGLTDDDLKILKEDFKKIDVYIERREYKGVRKRKFKRAMNILVNGGVPYTSFTIDALLNDKETDNDIVGNDQMEEDSTYHAKVNAKKLAITLFMSTLLATLVLRSVFDKSWLEVLIKNATVIGSNILTSSLKAKNYINYRRAILHNRNVFFSNSIPNEYLVQITQNEAQK